MVIWHDLRLHLSFSGKEGVIFKWQKRNSEQLLRV
jgi:hypothetical protein